MATIIGNSRRPEAARFKVRAAFAGAFLGVTEALSWAFPTNASAFTLSNGTFEVETGSNGEISSLQLTGDAFPTNYVLNATNAPGQNTPDHEWVGELMFTYRLGTGPWMTALTNQSADVRTMTQSGNAVTVTYKNSGNAEGVQNFTLMETYSLIDDYLYWKIQLTNTSAQSIEFGDLGLPLPFNEYWPPSSANEVIYETRVVYHSFTGNSSSYVTIGRPSGVGNFLLMTPDPTTGAGFEYMDNWISQEHPGSAWVAGGGTPPWTNGLDVFYIHSNVIKSTNRGYLPNTSLTLAPNTSQTYAFKFFNVTSHADVESRLYTEGLVDVTVVPSLMLATNMTAKIDLHTSRTIGSVTAQYPSQTAIASLGTVATGHQIYQVNFTQLGPNDVTVSYGAGETTTLQFYVLEPIDAALQRHATFMVNSMQATGGSLDDVFDDWMMDTMAQRGLTGGGGWGDDWGWTKGEFLAEKNAGAPVAAEVSALDAYLAAVEANAIDDNYVVQDWWCPPGTSATNVNGCFYNQPFAYPHAFNTYFSMYKVASYYPNLISYQKTADAYLLYAYGILNELYAGGVDLNPDGTPTAAFSTGYMGEQTLPDIAQALTAGGHTTEAANVTSILSSLYQTFKGNPYPYGSEYSYDNTGEEAVYTAAKANGDLTILGNVNAKTRACRGQEPVWYYYADPVTNNGENWWQFQYTAALAGYCMDDWLRAYSTTPELDERLSYAAKIANLGAINSGQIDSNPANLGTVAWTYQAMKGNYYVASPYATGEAGNLHNDWRQMSGEADLGLFGALRILSADVSVDPIFGLCGYGCNVEETNGCYSITPTDGVFKRLNLISQRLHVDISRDRYSGATVSTTSDYVGFTLENQTPSAAHTTTLTLLGLATGTYDVTVGGTDAGSVSATEGQAATVSLAIGTDATYSVTVGSGCGGATKGTDGGDGKLPADAGEGGVERADASTHDGGGARPDASTGDASGPSSADSSGCACTVTGESVTRDGASGLFSLAAIAAIFVRRRRRTSAPPRSRLSRSGLNAPNCERPRSAPGRASGAQVSLKSRWRTCGPSASSWGPRRSPRRV